MELPPALALPARAPSSLSAPRAFSVILGASLAELRHRSGLRGSPVCAWGALGSCPGVSGFRAPSPAPQGVCNAVFI